MYKWVSIISFAVVLAGLLLHHWMYPCGYKPRFSFGTLIRKKVHLFTLIFPEQRLSLPGKFRKLFFLVALLSFFVLLLTGFLPAVFDAKLQGYWLMLHATFAPVFIACVAAVAVLGAGQYRFNQQDRQSLPCCRPQSPIRGCRLINTGIGAKAGFWLLLLLSLPVTMTMVPSMMPWFGTAGQELLYHAHRWSALVFALTAIVELYCLVRMQIREDIHGRTE